MAVPQRPRRPTAAQTRDGRKVRELFELENSTITLEPGPAGTLARIQYGDGRTEWAGPFDDPETLRQQLAEVADT